MSFLRILTKKRFYRRCFPVNFLEQIFCRIPVKISLGKSQSFKPAPVQPISGKCFYFILPYTTFGFWCFRGYKMETLAKNKLIQES